MNPDTELPADATTSPQPPLVSSPAEGETPNSQPTPFAYRGIGKIARLPKTIRDQINNWMLDGLSYPDIIQRLGGHGQNLKPDNLSQWKKRGHQDWLLEQTWLAQLRSRQESASDLASNFDATPVNHAALQLAVLQIFEALRSLNPPSHAQPGTPDANAQPDPALCTLNSALPPDSPVPGRPISMLDFSLGGDCAAFARLINALARASRETMLLQKYREACARAREELRQLMDPDRDLSDREIRAIVSTVDRILGLS